MSLFNTFSSKSVRLEEFEQVQFAATDSVANHLRDNWTASIKSIIKYATDQSGMVWLVHGMRNKCGWRFPRAYAVVRELLVVSVATVQTVRMACLLLQDLLQGCGQGLVQSGREQL